MEISAAAPLRQTERQAHHVATPKVSLKDRVTALKSQLDLNRPRAVLAEMSRPHAVREQVNRDAASIGQTFFDLGATPVGHEMPPLLAFDRTSADIRKAHQQLAEAKLMTNPTDSQIQDTIRSSLITYMEAMYDVSRGTYHSESDLLKLQHRQKNEALSKLPRWRQSLSQLKDFRSPFGEGSTEFGKLLTRLRDASEKGYAFYEQQLTHNPDLVAQATELVTAHRFNSSQIDRQKKAQFHEMVLKSSRRRLNGLYFNRTAGEILMPNDERELEEAKKVKIPNIPAIADLPPYRIAVSHEFKRVSQRPHIGQPVPVAVRE